MDWIAFTARLKEYRRREDYETVQAMIEAGLYEVEPHMPEVASLALGAEPAETA